MNLRPRKNPIVTFAFAGSVLLHLAIFWLFGSIEQKIQIELAGQKQFNVRLAASSLAQGAASEETSRSTAKALMTPEPKIKQPAKPLKQASAASHVQKPATQPQQLKHNKSTQNKTEPVKTASFPESKALVTSRIPQPVTAQAPPIKTSSVSVQDMKTLPDKNKQPVPNKQTEPDNPLETHNQTDVQETASRSKVTEKESEGSELRISENNQPSSVAVPNNPRYQLGSAANPEPDYPMLARKKGWQGDVILGVHLEADGSIKHLTFVKSTDYGILNHAAYETVRTQWRFDPLEGENALANSYIEVPISFRFN